MLSELEEGQCMIQVAMWVNTEAEKLKEFAEVMFVTEAFQKKICTLRSEERAGGDSQQN